MKAKLLNIIKWFLIILGVLFLIEFLLFVSLFVGLFNFEAPKIKPLKQTQAKEIAPIVKYIDKYKNENNTYPDNINEVKLNKNYEYNYELSKDKNCYTITAKSKKNSSTKQYQECSIESENSSSHSQVYMYKD